MDNVSSTAASELSAAEIKDAILYKLVSIAIQVANDPRDVDDLGRLVNALEEASR